MKNRLSQKPVPGSVQRKVVPQHNTFQKNVAPYKRAVELLMEDTQNRFGIEAEITTTLRDMYDESIYIAQAAIVLPEGLKFCSIIYKNRDEELAKDQAATELSKILDGQIRSKQILLYRGSQWYQNHIKALHLIRHENNFGEIFYTQTERNGIYTIQAHVEKYKLKFSGNPAVHLEERTAKEHAHVQLAIRLMKELVSFSGAANLVVSRTYFDKLEAWCNKSNSKLKKYVNKIVGKGYIVHQYDLTVFNITISELGITPEHARERAAEKLYKQLVAYTNVTKN